MTQQVNLFTPILLAQKSYLSAQTIAIITGIFLVFGGGVTTYWRLNMKSIDQTFQVMLKAQEIEISQYKDAIVQHKKNVQAVGGVATKDLREQLTVQESRLVEFKRGRYIPDNGYSDVLTSISRSIPTSTWVNEIQADSGRLRIQGLTTNTADLNQWLLSFSSKIGTPKSLTHLQVDAVLNPTFTKSDGTQVLAVPQWSFMFTQSVKPVVAPSTAARNSVGVTSTGVKP